MHVLVHGGAGSAPDDPTGRQDELDGAAAAGRDAPNPLDAVCRAVRHLESAPQFNAGVGSVVQSDGQIRTDAGVMTGDGRCGAACAMEDVEHAVDVARAVATETPHVMLAGDGARSLADAVGVATGCDLWTPNTRERWESIDPPSLDEGSPRDHLAWVRDHFGGTDTVGAVATDGESVAAATSTGGRWFALAGRVGDVPQVGAGFYASSTAAASATGEGEAIARFGLARRVVAAVDAGTEPRAAAERVLADFESETGGRAGVIVIDPGGTAGSAFNTGTMQTATAAE